MSTLVECPKCRNFIPGHLPNAGDSDEDSDEDSDSDSDITCKICELNQEIDFLSKENSNLQERNKALREEKDAYVLIKCKLNQKLDQKSLEALELERLHRIQLQKSIDENDKLKILLAQFQIHSFESTRKAGGGGGEK